MFGLTLDDLSELTGENATSNGKKLTEAGGLAGIEEKLKVSVSKGLNTKDAADLQARQKAFGKNEFPEPPSVTWVELFLESFQDTTVIVLVVAAVVSFVVGMYEDPAKGWIEGAAIISAVLIVAIVTATNNYNKELQFRKLNAVKDDITVQVIRDGVVGNINIRELLVGDVVVLNAGDKVPADGLLLDGSDVTANESSLTGESDDKKKSPLTKSSGKGEHVDFSLLSGTNLASGFAKLLVTSVGEHSRWGKTKALMAGETPATPLQEKLDVLAGQIGNMGMVTAVLTFLVMVSLWFLYPDKRPDITLYEHVIKAFIMGVTIVVVAVPEGLPLAVTLSLAYSTQRMMKDNNLIRVLAACETMGNATTICSDKTGTLTMNRMTVVEGVIVGSYYEGLGGGGEGAATEGGKGRERAGPLRSLPKEVVERMCEGIAVNSTANVIFPASSLPEVTGNKTEGALLSFIRTHFDTDYVPLRARFSAARGDRLLTFSSARKRMSVILRGEQKGGECTMYTKGAGEILLSLCSHYTTSSGEVRALSGEKRKEFEGRVEEMAGKALRAVAIAHRSFPASLLDGGGKGRGKKGAEEEEAEEERGVELEESLVLDAIFGIKDPLRPDVKDAVALCQGAGITVRMVTGDNVTTAQAIARECGILTEGGVCLEGPTFRALSPKQLDALLPSLQVLARSSPRDKFLLVSRLNGLLPRGRKEWEEANPGRDWDKERDLLLPGERGEWEACRGLEGGEVVGVTGDGTNDGPALKAADVGLAMGMSGTDVAKEASDIIILDDNFSSIVKSVLWGRAVYDNLRKFLTFQLTVNLTALSLTLLSASLNIDPPLNAVMMLWVNLIMDTMGALALGTEPPSTQLLFRLPYRRNAFIVSYKMMRNILVQFLFQLAVMGYLLHRGERDFHTEGERALYTVVFNTFVFCQVFNELNARSIGDEVNVFASLHKNALFVGILLFTVAMQGLIVSYGGDFVKTSPLTADQWIKCVCLGSLSLPLGGLMRLLPVSDSPRDFAPLPALYGRESSRERRLAEKTGTGKSGGEGGGLSLFLWVIVVTALPLVTYKVFEEEWRDVVAGLLK